MVLHELSACSSYLYNNPDINWTTAQIQNRQQNTNSNNNCYNNYELIIVVEKKISTKSISVSCIFRWTGNAVSPLRRSKDQPHLLGWKENSFQQLFQQCFQQLISYRSLKTHQMVTIFGHYWPGLDANWWPRDERLCILLPTPWAIQSPWKVF